MTETLSRKDRAAFRRLVIVDRLVSDIHGIMSTTPSPYREVRDILVDVRHRTSEGDRKLLRACRKAYLIAVEEEKAATVYNKARDILDKNPGIASDRKVSRLEKRYRAQLGSGTYRKARGTANRLYDLAGAGFEHTHVSIVAADGTLSADGTASVVIHNRSESDLIVTGISASSPDASVILSDARGFAVRQMSQRAVRICSDRSDIPVNVVVNVTYEMGRKTFTQRQNLRFDRHPVS